MPRHDADERLDHELVVGGARQAADEVAVDLQVAKRQVLEVLEGAEARAEVIERDRAAERLHAGAERPARAPCRRSRPSR